MKKRKYTMLFTVLVMLLVLCLPAQASAYKGFKTSKNGVIKYYNASGRLVKNTWFKVEKNKYYATASGALAKGVKKIDGKYYYFTSKGVNKKGWKTVGKNKYYFVSKDGSAATGLFKFKNGKTYYFTSKGVMKKNCWQVINGKHYYFTSSGLMKTGWLTKDGKKYYLIKASNMRGQRASGIFSVSGKLYYFDPDTGIMQTNTTISYNDRTYRIAANGVCTVVPDTSAPSPDMLFFLKFESGSEAYNQTGGDNGNACGAYQFDYRYALLPFVKYAYRTNKTVCKEFKTYAGYTDNTKLKSNKKFYAAWKKIYNRNKKTFAELQDTFARINYYDNVERALSVAGIDIVSRSDVVKGAVFSYSIQHGQSTAVAAVKAIKATSSMSDATFLKKLYAYRQKKFPAFKTRYTQEYKLALERLKAAN